MRNNEKRFFLIVRKVYKAKANYSATDSLLCKFMRELHLIFLRGTFSQGKDIFENKILALM